MDAEEGYCMISGTSFPPDVSKFYGPLFEWLEQLEEKKIKELSFNLKLVYYNTASSKLILDMMYRLEEIAQEGTEVDVNWHYPDDDDDLLDAGEEFERLVDLPFQHIPYEQDFD
jgi:hypothetical protein